MQQLHTRNRALGAYPVDQKLSAENSWSEQGVKKKTSALSGICAQTTCP